MTISLFCLRTFFFVLFLFVIFILERFRFPFLRLCFKCIFKEKVLGESIAMFVALIVIIFLIWGASMFVSDIPASVIVVENIKGETADYKIDKAIGNYNGVKVSFLETYLDNRTNSRLVLRPYQYIPKQLMNMSFKSKLHPVIINGDTVVKLNVRPNFYFTGPSETIRKGRLDSSIRWSLEISDTRPY